MPQDKKVRVLIADGGDHYKILEQIYHLLGNKYDVTFYVIDNKRYDYEELFPSIRKAKVLRCGMRGIPFFAKLLFHGARFDVINISTGPDGSHFTELFRIVCFYLCCVIYRRKIIFTVRNTAPYLPTRTDLFSRIRCSSIRLLRRFTFETQTMRDAFVEASGIRNALLAVSYDRYSDVSGPAAEPRMRADTDPRVRVGLLGSVNEQRRDYESICHALGELDAGERARLVLVTLGMCARGADHPVMQRLARMVEIDCRDGMLSEKEFLARGISCDLLLSPLTPRKAYGVFNGSGSFGDAIYLRKRMILPRFADPKDEFASVCIYYSSTGELADIFRNAGELSRAAASSGVFERFTTTRVLDNLLRDLQLNCGKTADCERRMPMDAAGAARD